MNKEVFFNGRVVFNNLNDDTIERMIDKGWIVDGERLELVETNDHRHLFNPKISLGKRMVYFEHINEQGCKCEDCGKPLSLHIRPFIEEDGTVNFKKIVCVCKKCRTNKLNEKDILVPQFKKDFSEKALNAEIIADLKRRFSGKKLRLFLSDSKYFKIRREELELYSLTKISLPPLSTETRDIQRETDLLKWVGVESMQQDLDLNDFQIRLNVRKFLSKENNTQCPCCGIKTYYKEYTIDHIQPKSKGGPNTMENFIGMCEKCNVEKDNMTVLQFLRQKHFQALPERILKVAYEEQNRMKERHQRMKRSIFNYETNRLNKLVF